MRREAEEDVRLRREEVNRIEERLTRREDAIEERVAELGRREQEARRGEQEVDRLRSELEAAAQDHRRELERIAPLTVQEAKEALGAQGVGEAKSDGM